jgi:hypothetical protein
MSSSISNSERFAAAAMTVAALGALELATRLWLVPASRDLNRLGSYPARARALMQAPGARVALVGNSATERGIDPPGLARALGRRLNRQISVEAFVADSAEIRTMYWMVERAFGKQRLRPDLVIVNFFDRNLEDGAPLDVGRLGSLLTGPVDWGELFRLDVRRPEERADLVLSWASAAYAARHRIKERVLTLLPGYKSALGRINEVNFEHDKRGRFAPANVPHEALRRFVARARASGVRVCFVAYPKQDRYQVADEARRIIADAGMLFLDLRGLDELRPEHYADNIHLNDAGRLIFTESLARALAAIWHP